MHRRPLVALLAGVAALSVVAVVAASLLGGSDRAPAPTTTTQPPEITLAVTGASLYAGQRDPGPLPAAVVDATRAVVERYLRGAVVEPLRTGALLPDLDVVVSDSVRARLAGPDRAVLVDEGLPTGQVRADRAEVELTGLTGADGAVAVVVGRILLDVRNDESVRVQRHGELVLVPAGAGWMIDGYSLTVTRDASGGTTTTTGSSAGGEGGS